MSKEHEDYHEDEELEDDASRSIFAAGWFRAVLVLTALGIAVVVALPYLLNWFEPAPAPKKAETRPTQTASAPPVPAPTPSVSATAPAMPTGPATPTGPAMPTGPATAAAPTPEKVRQIVPVPGMPRAASAAPVKQSLTPPPPAKVADSARSDRVTPVPVKSDARPRATTTHWVQLGLFKDAKNAEALARKLRDDGFSVQIARVTRGHGAGETHVVPGEYHVVRTVAFTDVAEAISARAALSQKGHSGFLAEAITR